MKHKAHLSACGNTDRQRYYWRPTTSTLHLNPSSSSHLIVYHQNACVAPFKCLVKNLMYYLLMMNK